MVYVVGVSSGAFGVAEARERIELVGLFKKAQSCITKGVQFVQLDLESISEFEEPRLKERMEREIKEKLGISYGVHSETKAFGVEAAELDSALETAYVRAHKRFVEILRKSGEIGAKYVLIHSSESDPFPMLALRIQPAELVDIYGRPFTEFLKEEGWIREWIMEKEGKFLWKEIIERDLDEYLKGFKKEHEDWYILTHEHEVKEGVKTREELEKEAREWGERAAKREKERLERGLGDRFYGKGVFHGPERWAYYITAKWMEKNNDPLWEKIVRANIEFFAAKEGKSVDEWAEEKHIDLHKLSVDDKNFRELSELWVPAVAAKYIWGHLNPREARFEDPKKILEKYDMPLVIETPMATRGVEEWLRFYNPLHIYPLVEEIGSKYLQLAIDIEHMLTMRLDPELVIRLLPEGAGKFVKVIHAGWPATLAPAHMPILLGSEQQAYLYKIYYKLREKGFGLDPSIEHYIVFERAGPETLQESLISLKKIAEFLEKGTRPEDLPPEFYGIGPKEIGGVERQLAAIREHAFEPLKGLIVVPEEEYGALGKAAFEKGMAEKWRREKYK